MDSLKNSLDNVEVSPTEGNVVSTTQERRLGITGIWTKITESKDLSGNDVILAFPDWSSNSWAFDKKHWEMLPVC